MKNIFAFSLGIRYLQVAFTTSKDSKKPPFAILYEESAEFQREKSMKKKLRWKRKRAKTTITMLCCVLCDTIFDISWFKNLNSYAGY